MFKGIGSLANGNNLFEKNREWADSQITVLALSLNRFSLEGWYTKCSQSDSAGIWFRWKSSSFVVDITWFLHLFPSLSHQIFNAFQKKKKPAMALFCSVFRFVFFSLVEMPDETFETPGKCLNHNIGLVSSALLTHYLHASRHQTLWYP